MFFCLFFLWIKTLKHLHLTPDRRRSAHVGKLLFFLQQRAMNHKRGVLWKMSWTRQDPGPDKTLTQARSRVQAKLWTRHAFALDAVWNDKRFSESRSFIDRGLKRHFYRLSRVLRLKGADRKMSTARPCALYVGQQQKRAANMLSQNENTLAFEKFRCMLFFRFAICRGISSFLFDRFPTSAKRTTTLPISGHLHSTYQD